MFATVTNRDGQLVPDLTRESFEIRDEGKPQPITLFDNRPQPIRLVVMLDVSGSMEGNLPLLRAAAEQLFTRLRPDDVARVGTFGNDVDDQPDVHPRAGELWRRCRAAIDPDAPTPLWRAIDEALDAFGDARRRARGRPGAERRQGQRPDRLRRALRQPGRDHRPRAQATT